MTNEDLIEATKKVQHLFVDLEIGIHPDSKTPYMHGALLSCGERWVYRWNQAYSNWVTLQKVEGLVFHNLEIIYTYKRQ